MHSPKERLLMRLSGVETDRVPVICPGGMMNMVTKELMELCDIYLPEAHSDAKLMSSLAYEVYNRGVFENVGVPFCMTVEASMYGAPVDFGSDIYEPHVKEYILKSVTEWNKLEKADLSKGRARTVTDAIMLLKEKTSDVPIVGNLTGPVSVASSLMEPVMYYKELRRKKEDAHRYMQLITDDLKKFARAQIEAGADVITISDPSGTGEILGPVLFEEFCVRYINEIIDEIRKTDAKVIVHICGQMHSVYKEVNKIKSDALSFDSIVPIKEARRNLPGRTIMGNVSTYALEFGYEDQIRKMTDICINNGSSIISPACGLGMKTPLSNIRSMITAAMERQEI